MIKHRHLFAGSVMSMALAMASSAYGQEVSAQPKEPEAANPGDIIVTANRRAQRAQDVGMAISQISGEDLAKKGATSAADLAQLVPGVYVAGAFGGQSQQYTIRGVTQSDFIDTIENPVAFYVDDVYVTAAQGQNMGFVDIDRVEILKGPQGTLFGRNATGGLVQNVIAKPKLEEFSGSGEVSYGRFNEVNAQGALNIPLGKVAAFRGSVLYSRVDNYWHNVYPAGGPGSRTILSFAPGGTVVTPNGGDLGGSRNLALRGQLLFEPTPDLTIRLTGSYAKTDASVSPYTQEATIAVVDSSDRIIDSLRVSPTETRLAIGPGGANYTGPSVIVPIINGVFARPAPGGDFFGYVPIDPKSLTLSQVYGNGNDADQTRAQVYAAHITYNLGSVELNSITSYQRYSKNVFLGDGAPVGGFSFGDNSHTKSWSEELRLSGKTDTLNWQTGFYYLDNRVDVLQGIIMPPGSPLANLTSIFAGVPIIATVGNQLNTAVNFTSKSASVFGQVEYKFADRWTVIAGGRYINEKQTDAYKEFNGANISSYAMSSIVVSPSFQPDYNNARTFNLWTGKFQLEFRPSRELLTYIGVNRGVKAGNYNAPFTFSPADIVAANSVGYKPEKLLSYEGGFKFTRGPLIFNASAFYYDYKDYQAFVFSTASGVVRNVDAKVYGVDIDAAYRLTDSLRLSGSFGWSHARIDNFAVAPGILRTVRPAYSPEIQATGSIDYAVPGSVLGGELSFNATANYAGEIYNNIRNFSSQRFAPRTLVNLSATWEDKRSGMKLTVFGKNVFDARYGQIGFDSTALLGDQLVSYGKPATYGVTIGFKF